MGAAGAVETRSVLLAEATGRAAKGAAGALLAERSEAGALAVLAGAWSSREACTRALAGAGTSREACAGGVEELEPRRQTGEQSPERSDAFASGGTHLFAAAFLAAARLRA